MSAADARGGRHRVIVAHLVMGVAFLGLLAVWALVVSGTVQGTSIRFLMPIPWVLAGVTGLVALILGDRRRPATTRTGWEGAAPTDFGDDPERDRMAR